MTSIRPLLCTFCEAIRGMCSSSRGGDREVAVVHAIVGWVREVASNDDLVRLG
jgi:hypothetical protein